MTGFDKHRALAVKLALERIDRYSKRRKTNDEQNEMLASLIEKHHLKDRPASRGRSQVKEIPLTVEKYRAELGRMANKYGKACKGKTSGIHDIFAKGNSLFSHDFLEKVEYAPQPHLKHSDDEDERDDEDDDEEVAFTNPKIAADTGRTESEATTIQDEIPNTSDESSQRNTQLTLDEQRDADKELQAPAPSPISPHAEVASEAKKRKRDVEDNGALQLEKFPKTQQHPSIVDLTATDRSTAYVLIDHAEGTKEKTTAAAKPDAVSDGSTVPNVSAMNINVKETAALVKLSDNDIKRSMNAIWTDIQSFARKLLDASQVHGKRQVELVLKPGPQLQSIYQLLFGEDWQKGASKLVLAGELDARSITEACVAAAAHDLVWKADLPWDTPASIMSMLSHNVPHIDRVLRESDPNLRLHNALWQAGSNMVVDNSFQQNVIRPHAEKIASTMMLTINAQLDSMGATVAKGKTEAIRQERASDLAAICSKVLVLKGQIKAAPDYYSWLWANHGRNVHSTMMEQIYAGGGEQEVMWAVTPLIQKRPSQDAGWQLVCPAKVFSRPRQ